LTPEGCREGYIFFRVEVGPSVEPEDVSGPQWTRLTEGEEAVLSEPMVSLGLNSHSVDELLISFTHCLTDCREGRAIENDLPIRFHGVGALCPFREFNEQVVVPQRDKAGEDRLEGAHPVVELLCMQSMEYKGEPFGGASDVRFSSDEHSELLFDLGGNLSRATYDTPAVGCVVVVVVGTGGS